jgi:dihydrofolate synthase/folylpolyglutamate synthase
MADMRWQKFLNKVRSPMMRRGDYTLEHVDKFYSALGRPFRKDKIIHVAGTNAKGTVTFKLARMLELSGFKTGLFLSPHLFSWRERVQVNSQLITKEYCGDFFMEYERLREKIGIELSFFEFFTVMGLKYFNDVGADFAVVEVGLGGRLDATNIIDASILSIITSISLDHTQTLGTTREQIAGNLSYYDRGEMRNY